MSYRPTGLTSLNPGSIVPERRAGPGSRAAGSDLLPALPHSSQTSHPPRSASSTRPAPGPSRPATWSEALPARAGSGLPDVRWLQRVQRRFIKALHGVATCSRFSPADCAARPLNLFRRVTGSGRPRRKCRRPLGGGTQRARAAHCSDASCGKGKRGRSRSLPARAPRWGRLVVKEQPRRVAQPLHVEPGLASQHSSSGQAALLLSTPVSKRTPRPGSQPLSQSCGCQETGAAESRERTTKQTSVVLGNRAVSNDNPKKKQCILFPSP